MFRGVWNWSRALAPRSPRAQPQRLTSRLSPVERFQVGQRVLAAQQHHLRFQIGQSLVVLVAATDCRRGGEMPRAAVRSAAAEVFERGCLWLQWLLRLQWLSESCGSFVQL